MSAAAANPAVPAAASLDLLDTDFPFSVLVTLQRLEL